MWSIFGKKKKTPQDVLEEKQKRVDKCRAKIENQRQGFLDHEKKLLAEIKKEAEQGNMEIAKIKAREVVMTRHHIEKFNKLESTLQGVSLKTQAQPSEPRFQETKGDEVFSEDESMLPENSIGFQLQIWQEPYKARISKIKVDAVDDAMERDQEEDEV